MVASLVQPREAGHSLLYTKPVVQKMERNNTGVGESVKKYFRKLFTKKTLKKRIPILEWGPQYDLDCLEGDLLAGFTVGLTVIPQGIAYAAVAGLDPTYGLYSAFMGCFLYLFFGSCKDITIGPTAIMAIMTHEYSGHGGPDFAILLCFLSGIIILAAGFCNLGFLITFISKPVISGFTSAAAITIASTQLKGIFGLKFSSEGIIETFQKLIEHMAEFRWQDFILGVACIALLLAMKKMREMEFMKPSPEDSTSIRVWKKIGFLSSVGRNAIVVVFAAILAYFLDDNQPFLITGEVKAGLPQLEVPPFSTEVNNVTLNFGEMLTALGAGVPIIPLISILESIAIASAFAGSKTIDATQEMYALGLCNLVGSFLQSMPVTGSFSRTAVNSTSGVKTPAGGVVTGILVVLALAVLTPYFKYIPKSTLSAVIICAVIFMVEYEVIHPVWTIWKLDQLPLWGTFLICLFWKLEYGILIGVLINICVLLYRIAKTKLDVSTVLKQDGEDIAYVLVEPHDGLFFPSVDHIRAGVSKVGRGVAQSRIPVVIDCCHFTGVDYTAAKGVKGLCSEFEKRQQTLIFTNVDPSLKTSLTHLYDKIRITSPDQLYNELKVSPIEELTGSPSNGYNDSPASVYNNGISSSEDRNDPEARDPLLGAAALDPKPVIQKFNS
ncbi:sodium-independent sulfate anion transporter-like isoform X7 [Macrobrachium rosenbergii]|uniref:sodium-independent sulfate anion transporter-like isoform X7 n=2 Tax=Macrobrachium rosenbergii TaxID=79674 RepID=UPI0034D73C26